MRKRGRLLLMLMMLCVAAALAIVLRQGYVPASLSPLPELDLAVARPWFLDWRLAGLRSDRESCRRILREPHATAIPVPETAMKDGCGLVNGVRVMRLGTVRVAADRLSCEMAAALALWLEHEVQPIAIERLGQRVAGITHLGTYACRNIVGSGLMTGFRSEHATANAIDISAFVLADGRSISIRQHWRSGIREQAFLREVHARACRYFRVALGPEFNAQHADHFHLDRGPLLTCK